MSASRSPVHTLLAWRCPALYAVVLCVASFLAGGVPFSSDGGITVLEGPAPRTQVPLRLRAPYSGSVNDAPAASVLNSINRVRRVLQGNATFEEALEASGLLRMKPPIPPSESGDKEYTFAPFQVLSWYPRAVVFPNFIDDRACQRLMDIANKRLAPSTLALRQGETEDGTKNIRTSSGTFVSSNEDHEGILRLVEEKIAKVTMLPVTHGEAFNVLRYHLGQKYDSHYDVFNPREYGPQSSLRAATVLLYLTTSEEGGETIFKLEGKEATQVTDYVTCDVGLKYKPRKGDALLFWSLTPNRTFDHHALHGGCPVKKGVKWAATKWVHDLPIW